MCGFIAYFSPCGTALEPDHLGRLDAALELIAHRGPDDSSTASGPGWWIGFRRLSILDLSECARQPMPLPRDRWLAFNGEIYNFRELRTQFAPHELRSTGDTEVLGNLLDHFGVEVALRQLRGMFAFGWWDAEKRELIFARDPFGIKPLYWTQTADGGVCISSEMAPLQKLGLAGGVSPEGVASYFRWGGVEAPETVFSGVRLLPPGHFARWKEGGAVTIERYFQPQWLGRPAWIRDRKSLLVEARNRVIESVEAHLESDVPVGVFLSAGLDSNIICAALRELGRGRFQAFSVGYDGQEGIEDESAVARRSAEFFGAEFSVERVSAGSLLETFDHFIAHLDSPSGDALNTYLVSRAASRHVKVALSGLGADEWFGGYNYARLAKLAQLLPMWRLTGAAGLADAVRAAFAGLPTALRTKRLAKLAALIGGAMGTTMPAWYRAFYAVLPERELKALLTPELRTVALKSPTETSGLHSSETDLASRAPDSWLDELCLLETEHHLPNVLLRDCDAMSMAHSLELRVPLVDREIFHLAGQVPPEWKLGWRANKRVLREAFRPLLPAWINEDRKKKTFTLPLMTWLREPQWRERVTATLLSERAKARGWLVPERVRAHVEEFYRSREVGRRGFALSQRVWLMFVLESWAQAHLDRA